MREPSHYSLPPDGNMRSRFGYEQKERKCLRCDRAFLSEWVGNRMCPSCKLSACTHREKEAGRVSLLDLHAHPGRTVIEAESDDVESVFDMQDITLSGEFD